MPSLSNVALITSNCRASTAELWHFTGPQLVSDWLFAHGPRRMWWSGRYFLVKSCRILSGFFDPVKKLSVCAWTQELQRGVNSLHSKFKPRSFAQGMFIWAIISVSHQWRGPGFVGVSGFSRGLSSNRSIAADRDKTRCNLMAWDRWQRKVMFAMRANPYLRTPLHRTKGIKG